MGYPCGNDDFLHAGIAFPFAAWTPIDHRFDWRQFGGMKVDRLSKVDEEIAGRSSGSKLDSLMLLSHSGAILSEHADRHTSMRVAFRSWRHGRGRELFEVDIS
jgi:hypothetical protein